MWIQWIYNYIHAIRPGLSGTDPDFDTLSPRPGNYEIPCLLTDQNFKNSSEKGHSRNISVRLFQNLTNSFREDFLGFCLWSFSQVAPIHQSHVHGQITISLTFLREVTLGTFL